MDKKKILWVGEASYLNSGYSNYSKEILTRLFETGKYEIAELAGYGNMSDYRVKTIPWKYYANSPEENDTEEVKRLYKNKQTNEFGEWRFDKTLIDFKPDICISIRDYWMDSFINTSHLRPYYSWLTMPTADSEPQQDEYINTYMNAEGVLTYTDWSKDVLDRQSGGKINTLGSAPYGIDYDLFSPSNDKISLKEYYGLEKDSIIIGTVMRNFKRKLFPDLMQAFSQLLKILEPQIAKRTYLYLHTSYPEKQCWNIPGLIQEYGIGTKTIVSYICKSCKKSSCSIFQDARSICPHCGLPSCVMPSVGFGHSREQLVDVYRLFDLYVQYSTCEGFGCPMVEAAACGVPVAAVDATAMSDVVRRIEGYPVKVQRWFREFESNAYRAYPDNDHLTQIMANFIDMPKEYKQEKLIRTRELAKGYFNWNRVAKIWEESIDNLPAPKAHWNDEPKIFIPDTMIKIDGTDEEFIEHIFNNVYHMPEGQYNFHGLSLLRDLNFGVSITSRGMERIDRKIITERLISKTEGRNLAEQVRCGITKISEDNFIKFANNRNIKQ